MLFNILDINARACTHAVVALMVPAALIAFSLSTPRVSVAEFSCANEVDVDAAGLLSQAELYKSAKKYELALPLLDEYLAAVPCNAEAYADKAFCLNGLHRFSDALVSADQGISYDGANIDVLSNKAWALNHLGRYQEALKTANTALGVDPTDAESWCAQGEALMGMGDCKAALVAFNKHCGLHEHEWYAFDRRAECYEKLGFLRAAAEDRRKSESL